MVCDCAVHGHSCIWGTSPGVAAHGDVFLFQPLCSICPAPLWSDASTGWRQQHTVGACTHNVAYTWRLIKNTGKGACDYIAFFLNYYFF